MLFADNKYFESLHKDSLSSTSMLVCSSVVCNWLRCMNAYRGDLKSLYDNPKFGGYKPVFRGDAIEVPDNWEFHFYDEKRCVCYPPYPHNHPSFEPLLGCKDGDRVTIVKPMMNSLMELKSRDMDTAVSEEENTDMECGKRIRTGDELSMDVVQDDDRESKCVKRKPICRQYSPFL